jgi:aldehyde dehydrogenase (NAD+)
VVNDMVVPTADPRLPFAARGRSGFGVTRGPEGLLSMTRIKSVAHRQGSIRPHLMPTSRHTSPLLAELLKMMHSRGLMARLKSALSVMRIYKKQLTADENAD